MIHSFITLSGLVVTRGEETIAAPTGLDMLIDSLGTRQGMLLRCNFTFPGRYRPHWLGFVDPPLRLSLRADHLSCRALNERGSVLLPAIAAAFAQGGIADLETGSGAVKGRLATGETLFETLRSLVAGLSSDDPHLGLFGPFGFDLAFHTLGLERRGRPQDDHEAMVLYLPDRIVVADHPETGQAKVVTYDFALEARSTEGMPRTGSASPLRSQAATAATQELPYADMVRRAVEACRSGELFEVVLAQTFRRELAAGPDALFRLLDRINPSPYEFLANLGTEALVGASPEMFVRVEGRRVESCPISGTIQRGDDAVADAERALELLNSSKAAAELTMCTDIDRDDKAGLCEPGSIRLLGRRQIETYSHLLHTVDHVEGQLRLDRDAIDAFRAHVWAVTLTGAPRQEAIAFIDANEAAPRRWYGGAIGRLGFDGRLDTGIVLRSMRLAGGTAEITVGATILHSSDPIDEERETVTKAGALLRTLDLASTQTVQPAPPPRSAARADVVARIPVTILGGAPFAQILEALLRSAGADVALQPLAAGLRRPESDRAYIVSPDLSDAALVTAREVLANLLAAGRPVLALGHGMVALAQLFGAKAEPANTPRHGERVLARPSVGPSWLLPNRAESLVVGCYHRCVVLSSQVPAALHAIARDDADEVLALEHGTLPVGGLLFRPESLLTRHPEGPVHAFLQRAEDALLKAH
ncbi:chorismate-binding protein [Bosea sp. NBC_00550]|uniref:chorismate-binding protein n=1 Tax=Bosea sp. NBC_00550 TaxID=2969621 RepID=UPI00222EE208|nr:chorismate-binding protein [Bosea sp. NBC_00550]UZF94957.1 chorismate-binding protein [Bosea sp. NBC_00550]